MARAARGFAEQLNWRPVAQLLKIVAGEKRAASAHLLARGDLEKLAKLFQVPKMTRKLAAELYAAHFRTPSALAKAEPAAIARALQEQERFQRLAPAARDDARTPAREAAEKVAASREAYFMRIATGVRDAAVKLVCEVRKEAEADSNRAQRRQRRLMPRPLAATARRTVRWPREVTRQHASRTETEPSKNPSRHEHKTAATVGSGDSSGSDTSDAEKDDDAACYAAHGESDDEDDAELLGMATQVDENCAGNGDAPASAAATVPPPPSSAPKMSASAEPPPRASAVAHCAGSTSAKPPPVPRGRFGRLGRKLDRGFAAVGDRAARRCHALAA